MFCLRLPPIIVFHQSPSEIIYEGYTADKNLASASTDNVYILPRPEIVV